MLSSLDVELREICPNAKYWLDCFDNTIFCHLWFVKLLVSLYIAIISLNYSITLNYMKGIFFIFEMMFLVLN